MIEVWAAKRRQEEMDEKKRRVKRKDLWNDIDGEEKVLRNLMSTRRFGKTRRATTWWPKERENKRLFVHMVFDDPDSSYAGMIFSIISSSAVILSCIALVISSLPEYRFPRYGTEENDTTPELDQIELVCTIFFTIEYFTRLVTASAAPKRYIISGNWEGEDDDDDSEEEGFWTLHWRRTWAFFWRPLNVIDLIAILPFYLENGTGTSINLTSLRIGRLIRLAKLFKSNKMIPLMVAVFSRSSALLSQVAALLLIFVTIAACLIFLCEGGNYSDEQGLYVRKNVFGEEEPTPFTSVYISMWWVIVTFTTVGYGDMAPATPQGRAIGSFIIFISLVLFAIPITIVTDVFLQEFHRSEEAGYGGCSGGSQGSMELKKRPKLPIDAWKTPQARERAVEEGVIIQRMMRQVKARKNQEDTENEVEVSSWYPRNGSNFIEKAFLTFEGDAVTYIPMIVQGIIQLAIIVSAITITVESLEQYRYPQYGDSPDDQPPAFVTIEIVSVVIFTFELACRIGCVGFCSHDVLKLCQYELKPGDTTWISKTCMWIKSPMTIIDILSTLPYYLEAALPIPSLTFLRVLRLLRMIRLVRVARSTKGFVVLTNAMSKSIRPLGNLAVLFAGWIIFCSSVMFYCEQGVWNEEKGYYERTTFFGEKERSPFRSIPDTCYWMVVTMTTVGYGDLFPTTLPGRLVGSLIVFVSIICLAVPISMVGVNIDQASSEYIKRAKGEEDTLADRNEIPEVDLSDQTIEYAEDLYALLRSAHKSLEDIADAIEPHLNPKKHNLKGIPPTSILLLERSFRVVKASFRRSELMTHKLINNELYGMMTLKHSVAARPLIRNKLFTNRIVMARTAFLGWRTWTRENREKRAQGMNTNFTSPKLPEEVETKSVSPSNKTSPVPKTLEAELGETKLSSSYMNGISRPNTSLRRSTEPGILSSPSAKEKKQNRDRFIGSVSMPPGSNTGSSGWGGTVATVNSGETVASTEKAGTP